MQQVEKREMIEQLEKQLKLVSCDTVGNTNIEFGVMSTSELFHSGQTGCGQPLTLPSLALGEFEMAALALTCCCLYMASATIMRAV